MGTGKTWAAIAFTLLLSFQHSARLKGNYRVEFDSTYQLLNYKISFDDSLYIKTFADGRTSKGKIGYDKYKIVIRQNMSEDPIEIDPRQIGKDTIAFTTKSKSDASRTVNRGKLIVAK